MVIVIMCLFGYGEMWLCHDFMAYLPIYYYMHATHWRDKDTQATVISSRVRCIMQIPINVVSTPESVYPISSWTRPLFLFSKPGLVKLAKPGDAVMVVVVFRLIKKIHISPLLFQCYICTNHDTGDHDDVSFLVDLHGLERGICSVSVYIRYT